MIAHPHLILLVKMLLYIILLLHYTILVIVCSNSAILTKNRCFLLATHAALPVVSVPIAASICIIIVIDTMWILLRSRSNDVFWTWPRLDICDIHAAKIVPWVTRSMHLLSYLSWVVDIVLFIVRLVWIDVVTLIFLNLSRLQTSALFFLIDLIWLFLRTSIKITTCNSKLFHLYLWIDSVIIMRFLWVIFIFWAFLPGRTLRINSIWIYLWR